MTNEDKFQALRNEMMRLLAEQRAEGDVLTLLNECYDILGLALFATSEILDEPTFLECVGICQNAFKEAMKISEIRVLNRMKGES